MVVSSILSPALVAQSTTSGQNQQENKKNVNGLGFVVSSSGGARLKDNKLYYRDNKGFKSVHISGRMVSERIPARSGQVELWSSDPTPATPDAKPAPPDMIASIPAGAGSRPICIVQLYKDKDSDATRMNSIVIGSNVIPSEGQHIINLSGYPLTIAIAKQPNFSDRKDSKIAANRHQGRKIDSDNIWSLKGAHGDVRSFMLMATLERNKAPVRVRSSRFAISTKQAQVTLVLKNPDRPGVKLESIIVSAPQVTPAAGR